MNTRSTLRPGRAAFTLLELLAVMTIIAILMAILIPTSRMVLIASQKQKAAGVCKNIVAAVTAYQADYSKYPTVDSNEPAPDPASNEDTVVGDSKLIPNAHVVAHNNALFDTLRAINHETNPKNIVFFSDLTVHNPDLPKGGFLDKPGQSSNYADQKGCLFDPWGSEYFVVMDTNYDNQINVTRIYQDFAFPDSAPRIGVGAFSLGLDQRVGSASLPPNIFEAGTNKSDDVLSWQ